MNGVRAWDGPRQRETQRGIGSVLESAHSIPPI
jgi:hypothetical protein